MRRTTVTVLLAVTLLAGCDKSTTPPPQTREPPKPAFAGVALADLDLKAAAALQVRMTPAPASHGPAPDLTDVAFVGKTDGFAVTESGVIASSRDGGVTWNAVYHLKGGRFSRVEALDSQTVFAAAQTGCDPGPNCEGPQVLLRTTDGGQTWKVIHPQFPALELPGEMHAEHVFAWLDFQFLSPQVGYAKGDLTENHLLRSPPLMVTRDGGETWAAVRLPDGLSYSGGFSFASPDRGYVTAFRSATGESLILSTGDGGSNWQPLFATKEYGLFAVDFPTAKDGFIGGGLNPKTEAQPRQIVLATHDGGITWAEVSRVEDRGSPVVELRMISPTEGWALRGGCWSMGGNGPCGGRLWFTRDGGSTWTDTGHGVNRIRTAGEAGWAIDGNGATTLWRTGDGGRAWQQLRAPNAVRVSQVQFLSPAFGFIATNQGFYQTRDGGRSWTPSTLKGPFETENQPLFLDQSTALGIFELGLQRSADGGRTWQHVAVPLPEKTDHISMPALAVTASSAGTRPPDAWLAMESLTCMNPDCPAFLIHSGDGGATWQPVQPGPQVHLHQITFADALHGVGVTWRNQLLLTTDGGHNWVTQAAPKELSLLSATYAGSPDHLWVAGTSLTPDYTSRAVFLHSIDGGQHWTASVVDRMLVQQIQFVNARDGWLVTASGEPGSGLLVTHDGGQTWTEVWPEL